MNKKNKKFKLNKTSPSLDLNSTKPNISPSPTGRRCCLYKFTEILNIDHLLFIAHQFFFFRFRVSSLSPAENPFIPLSVYVYLDRRRWGCFGKSVIF